MFSCRVSDFVYFLLDVLLFFPGHVQPVPEPVVLVTAPPVNSMTSSIDWRAVIIVNVIKFGAAAALTYFSVRLMIRAMDDLGRNKKQIEGDVRLLCCS